MDRENDLSLTTPDPPRPPGVPDLSELEPDVGDPMDTGERRASNGQDFNADAGSPEPTD